MIPHMSATDAVANAAGTTGIDVMEWTAPDGTSSNLIPPTLGMIDVVEESCKCMSNESKYKYQYWQSYDKEEYGNYSGCSCS